MNLTRRAFLQLATAIAASMSVPLHELEASFDPLSELDHTSSWRMGRALKSIAPRRYPSSESEAVRWLRRDDTCTILGAVTGENTNGRNDVWYLVPGGYVYSTWVQPVMYHGPQQVQWQIPDAGQWFEVASPYTDARYLPRSNSYVRYRLYHQTLHRAIKVEPDEHEGAWYLLYDDRFTRSPYWVRARDMKPLTAYSFRPIHPHIPTEDKRVEVDLSAQTVSCWERDQRVFLTRCSSGAWFTYSDGISRDYTTPIGKHEILLKLPSRHMRGGVRGESDFFDLPGVPWGTFFTYKGAAIHGTYWHNDYGVRRSHGCLNVTPDAAKWIFRWTSPVYTHETNYIRRYHPGGTQVLVA